jgi:hypothetical protein
MRKFCGDNGLLNNFSGHQFPVLLKRLFVVILASLLCLSSARAQDADDQYLLVLKLIHQADTLNASGSSRAALTKYRQAQAALSAFQHNFPDWNSKVLVYRNNYLSDKIGSLSTNPAAAEKPAVSLEKTGQENASAGAKVKLIEPGAEPKQTLRLHPKAGDKQTLSMTFQISIATKMGAQELPAMKMPAMIFTMDATVKEVAAEGGDITYEMVMGEGSVADEPGAIPQVAEMMKSIMGTMKGLTGTGVMSSRGLTKGFDFKAPANADPQARQMLDQMKQGIMDLPIPLPEDAIGQGAKWQFKRPVTSQGITLDQTFDFTLVSVHGDQVNATVALKQTAPKQKIESPAMPGTKMDLNKMTGSGKGETLADLTQLFPVKGNLNMHSEMSMGMNAGAQQQAMNMNMEVGFSFETK